MSESLAWYYAMQVVRETHGDAQLRRLLGFMRQPNPSPPIRRGEPLLRGLDPWMSYRKGPFALHALSRYMGEERINTALRNLVEKHRSGAPPLANTLDLYRELQAVTPDSLQYLLHGLFEVNTVWELETERVAAERVAVEQGIVAQATAAAPVEPAGAEGDTVEDGKVERGAVAQGRRSRRSEAPGASRSTCRPARSWRTAPAPRPRRRWTSGWRSASSAPPSWPGSNPYHVLDWEEREDDDNIETVVIGG